MGRNGLVGAARCDSSRALDACGEAMTRYAAGVAVGVLHGVFLLHGGTTFWSVMHRGGTDFLFTSLLLLSFFFFAF